ncbi:ribbon-helix-helix domain-containing protein [Micromonospora sp. MH99]|uniref:ribbon-helix-helix domain-containing protein n=1 Tax=Micromonospora sp. MH99 TaxID=1945510 RepID=UPI001F3E2DD9|nr:ribbon-helix-helix domain-containing protein [Micromonospora sp. MH99]
MAMTLRLDDERERRLRLVADEEGRSMHAVVVTAIDDYLARRNAKEFGDLADEIIERHATLLARLAE